MSGNSVVDDSILSDRERLTKLITQVKQIATIQVNKRVSTTDGVAPYASVWPSWIDRRLAGESRATNMLDLSRVIRNAIAVTKYAIHRHKEIMKNTDTESDLERLENKQLIDRCSEAIDEATVGIRNFRETYQDDPKIYTQVDVLLREISDSQRSFDATLRSILTPHTHKAHSQTNSKN